MSALWARLGLLGGLVLAALVGPPVRADVVLTNAGKRLEGKVVSQDGDVVVIETTFAGRQEVRRADVKKVDTSVPPLRDQLAYRLGEAGADAKALTSVAAWAKSKGFTTEIDEIWRKILDVEPANARAHKALGHVLVAGAWLTPEEKAAVDAAAEDAKQRAKGLVPYDGRWVTPEERDALEKGLLRDGDAWVTEDEYHRRRGERKVDGAWVRVGEAAAKARAAELSKKVEAPLVAYWGPHVDLYVEDFSAEDAATLQAAAEGTIAAFLKVVRAEAGEPVSEMRVPVYCFQKPPAYARFALVFDAETKISSSFRGFEGWPSQVARQRSWWWTDPPASGHYLFPNTVKAIASNVAHNLACVFLNRWKFNRRFNSTWLQEGLAYALELEAVGSTQSFTVGRSGGGGDPAAWTDTSRWKDSLKAAVSATQDTPMHRLAAFGIDGMTYGDLVKSWSAVDYLRKADENRFRAFLAGTKVKDRPEEDALKEAYGFDFRGLEERWRAWVEGGFTGP